MTTDEVLKECKRLLIEVYLDTSGQSCVRDPQKQMTPELMAALKEHKAEIVTRLRPESRLEDWRPLGLLVHLLDAETRMVVWAGQKPESPRKFFQSKARQMKKDVIVEEWLAEEGVWSWHERMRLSATGGTSPTFSTGSEESSRDDTTPIPG